MLSLKSISFLFTHLVILFELFWVIWVHLVVIKLGCVTFQFLFVVKKLVRVDVLIFGLNDFLGIKSLY